MSKSNIVAAFAVTIGGAAVALLFAQNTKLKRELEILEVEVVRYRESTPATAQSPSGLKGSPEEGHVTEADDRGGTGARAFSASTLQKILAQRDPAKRLRALLDYIDGLNVADIPDALQVLRANSPDWDPDAKVAASLMLRRWGGEDPDAAFAYVEGLGLKRGGGDAAVVLSAIAAEDPQRAIEWLQNPDNKLAHVPWMGHIFAGTITKEWMRSDPDAALAWAATVPDNQRTGAYTGVLETLAATDPARAGSLVAEIEEGKVRTDVIGRIAKAWSEQSPRGALDWAIGLDGADRDRAVGEALGGWAQSDPGAAAAYLDDMPSAESDPRFAVQVATNWAQQAPAEAADWLQSQPDSASKPAAMGQVMWSWTVADPQAASTWLAEQPSGEVRDSAIGALAKATFDTDPEGAVSWAATISNAGQRSATLDRGVRTWLEREPEAARRWIDGTDTLTAEEVQKFTAQPASPPSSP